MINFEYPEDAEFFANLLAEGDLKKVEKDFSEFFDFEDPTFKRKEFDKQSKKILAGLFAKYGRVCQLRLHIDCSNIIIFEPDHIIPLSSNELNKKIRRMTRFSTAKVEKQSFGSNNMMNLTLACKRCNAYKKNKFFKRDLYKRLINNS